MTFTLGVNYWPRKKAMYWWKAFDRAEVASEFAEIAALKLQVARIFLFWEDFQPSPEKINPQALIDLGVVLDTAQAIGIKVMPTFFTGHMSGANWWPSWALLDREQEVFVRRCISDGKETTRAGRDPYTDPLMLDAELRLVKAVCGRYGEHPAIYSWNFSNEPDIFYQPKSFQDSARWNALLTKEVRKYSTRPTSAGIHQPAVAEYTGFRPDYLAPANDYLSMHGYSIFYPGTAISDPLNSNLIPFTNLVTEALGGKPVLFEEFGYSSSEHGDVSVFKPKPFSNGGKVFVASDVDGGRYYQEVLEKLALCGSLGAFGWDFSDYDPSLWGLPPLDLYEHERFFGLTRYDGTVKPSGLAMRAFAERIEAGELPRRVFGPLTLDPDHWYTNPEKHFAQLFAEWNQRLNNYTMNSSAFLGAK
ncbi:glycoside hydrolase 5 family protein [Tengunoibacter tsumagoiensis]|uniref:Glycoside hydrolase family 42 N-terminal domain-containing protein n=1 Tax=Tengunoibacter tsumagoiensis TaxID=2014871 RepID=A0A401ZY31_9CHLR|nr:beta-galactosidase [Tengunoibacter tsumagoiensis]GCE11749.1 hypothetical protein KTT_16080 [Tengunoibacter tsumagoiensis]